MICWVQVGSGSTFAYGVLDTGYQYDLTVDEAIHWEMIQAGLYRNKSFGTSIVNRNLIAFSAKVVKNYHSYFKGVTSCREFRIHTK